MARNKRKAASILIILSLFLPFFWTFSYFANSVNIGGSNPKIDSYNPKLGFNLPNPLGLSVNLPKLSDEKSTFIANKNSDVIKPTYTKPNPKTSDRDPKKLSEYGDSDLPDTVAKQFKTKLIVRDQKQEAVTNTFNPLKTSYDIIYGNQTATIFAISNDPSLKQENAISINYTIAKRLGINVDKLSTFDVLIQQKK
jgi:hypothetical protein